MRFETLNLKIDGAVATIEVDRPDSLNALNTMVTDEILQALDVAEGTSGVRVVVVTGAGEKAFVAGADIREMLDMDPAAGESVCRRGMPVYDRLRHSPLPVLASINGYALGGGMLLAMACDIRIAADSAVFGYPEIRLGVFPGNGGTILIDRLIGPAAARAICLLGEHFPAERAYQLGLVAKVVPKADLAAETAAMAGVLAGYSPVAIRELKAALNASMEQDFQTARDVERQAWGRCFASADRIEGMSAFVEKRPPKFVGR